MATVPHLSISVASGSRVETSGCPRFSLPDSAQKQGTHLQPSLGSRSWDRLTCSLSRKRYWTPNPSPTWPPPHPRVFTETLLWDGQCSRFHSGRLHASRTEQPLKPEPCGWPTPAIRSLLEESAGAGVVLLAGHNRWRTVHRHRWRLQDAEVHRPGWRARARTTRPTQL